MKFTEMVYSIVKERGVMKAEKEQISQLRGMVRSLRERRSLLKKNEFGAKEALKAVKKVVSSSSPGRGMKILGLALLLPPEPFTDMVGAPLFLLGSVMDRTHGSIGVRDVLREADETLSALRELDRL